jgi:hypothetical protein
MTNIITESESDRSTDRNLGLEWQMVTFPALAHLAFPSMQISIRVVRLVDVAHCGAFVLFFSPSDRFRDEDCPTLRTLADRQAYNSRYRGSRRSWA